MSDINITIDGGTSKRLLTAGKMCDRNIFITATGGGGGDIPEEAFNFGGDISYTFSQGNWDWFIESYGHRITTDNITSLFYGFANSRVENIPFTLKAQNIYGCNLGHAFMGSGLKESPKIRLLTLPEDYLGSPGPCWYAINLQYLFQNCQQLRNADDAFIPENLEALSYAQLESEWQDIQLNSMFYNCYSLRTVPKWFYKLRFHEDTPFIPNIYYMLYSYTFGSCHTLDEVLGLQVISTHGWNNITMENMFDNTFEYCYRLKNMTFETQEDGTPLEARWTNQTLNLAHFVGYSSVASNIVDYNSGIDYTTRVENDADYSLLKDDPDWWTTDYDYSRYNHDSAVATINSLPDTSAAIAEVGGTNTIKFKGDSGSSTDGGAISALTEEEIAVAAAKGWTVTFE